MTVPSDANGRGPRGQFGPGNHFAVAIRLPEKLSSCGRVLCVPCRPATCGPWSANLLT